MSGCQNSPQTVVEYQTVYVKPPIEMLDCPDVPVWLPPRRLGHKPSQSDVANYIVDLKVQGKTCHDRLDDAKKWAYPASNSTK